MSHYCKKLGCCSHAINDDPKREYCDTCWRDNKINNLIDAGGWAIWLIELPEIQKHIDPTWGDPEEILKRLRECGCEDPNKEKK